MEHALARLGVARNSRSLTGPGALPTFRRNDSSVESDHDDRRHRCQFRHTTFSASSQPVVVDFWAEWCGPCKMIAPHLEEISTELDGKVKIVKLNIDENQQTTIRYGVRSIPTLIMFKNGEPVDMKVGAGPKSDLQKWIQNAAA